MVLPVTAQYFKRGVLYTSGVILFSAQFHSYVVGMEPVIDMWEA